MYELRVTFEGKNPFVVATSRSAVFLYEKASGWKRLKGVISAEVINQNPPEAGRKAQKSDLPEVIS